ncbi:MAG: hypothetical protein J6M16_03255 [Clostridia bacterium]|nr:hypothetical protein [Clostridia bacterium]
MKKFLSVLLCVVLALACFTACSAKEELTGTWKADVNLADAMNQVITEGDPTVGEYIKFKEFTLTIVLELNEDGTYKMYADEAKALSSFESLKKEFKDGMLKYLEATLKDAGLDMSLEDALALTGMNVDDLIEESFSQDILDDMLEEMYNEGQYEAKDGKFLTSGDLDSKPTDNGETYKLEGNKLTLDGNTSGNEMLELIYPLSFKKA